MDKAKKNQTRYRLHRALKRSGIKLIAKQRTIYLPYGENIPDNKYLKELMSRFGYTIQTFIA